jgi:hypothetical protein
MDGYNETQPTDIIELKIENGLSVLDEKEASLIELASKFKGLKVNGVDDKEGFNTVRDGRLAIKKARVEIQKAGKALRENAVKFQKTVIERENQLIAIIEPVENELMMEESRIAKEKEDLRIAAERKENERIQARVKALSEFNYYLDLYDAKIMPEENFQALLGHAEAEFKKQQEAEAKAKAEAERVKREEEERLQREREELARQRAENEAKEAEIRASREKLERDQREREEYARKQEEEKQAWLKAEREKLEAEKRAFELEKQKKEAEERARIESENRIKREAEEKAERERLTELERQRQEALKPDKEKLLSYIKSLSGIPHPQLQDDKAKQLFSGVLVQIDRFCFDAKNQIQNL